MVIKKLTIKTHHQIWWPSSCPKLVTSAACRPTLAGSSCHWDTVAYVYCILWPL